jgi:hypothetical protein
MKGEEITANLDACSSIMCKSSLILEYHMETPNMALAKSRMEIQVWKEVLQNLVQKVRTYA